MAPVSALITISLLALQGAIAHPGHNVAEEAAERAEYLSLKPRTIRDCAAHLDRRGVTGGSIQRRQDLAKLLRTKRGLAGKPMLGRRDFSDYDFSHQSSSSYTLDTDQTSLFTDNSSCILQSEVTQGPYYVSGELIRQDVTDGQSGVPLYLDIQVIDTSTCEPVSAVYMDLWHCNSTGVYSGVVANGNGDSSDTSNLDSTAMRGIQQTDEDGIVQFQTMFPGHYDGRATHIHIMTHNSDATVVGDNSTLIADDSTTYASHVGQLFFDQDLISQISQISPYSESTAQIVENSEDSILAQEADTTDPFVEYVLLGSSLEDGILAWISIGIDPSKSSEVSAASTYYASGGVANENSMGGGSGGPGGSGSGGPGGNSTMSGSPPSGSGSATGAAPSGTGSVSGGPSGTGSVGGAAPSSTGTGSSAAPGGSATASSSSYAGSSTRTASTGTTSPSSSSTSLIANGSTGAAPPSATYGGVKLLCSSMALVAALAAMMLW